MQRLQGIRIARGNIYVLLYNYKSIFNLIDCSCAQAGWAAEHSPSLDFFVTFFVKKKSKERKLMFFLP